MKHWITIAQAEECLPGKMLQRVANDRIVALANVDGKFYAIDGVCAHQGGPLGRGALSGCIVACPWHGWQFDVTTGANQLNTRYGQQTFPVRLLGDEVQVEVDIDP